MPREIILSDIRIADDSDCFTIAEIGQNHCGSVSKCISMIASAKQAGADCVKLQKRTNRELYTPEFYNAPYNSEHSFGKTYGEHREALEFDEAQYESIVDYCRYAGIGFAATAFDVQAAHFLAKIGADWIKIASGDVENLPLLEEVAQLGLPVVLSTGGARSFSRVAEALYALSEHGSSVAVLQCTSGYPAEWEDLNLRVIEEFRAMLPHTVVGWSMHARGISQAPVAYALGARILEAHFTTDRYGKGSDQAMSLEPEGFGAMVRYMQYTRQALGDAEKKRLPCESKALLKQWKNSDGKIDGVG